MPKTNLRIKVRFKTTTQMLSCFEKGVPPISLHKFPETNNHD